VEPEDGEERFLTLYRATARFTRVGRLSKVDEGPQWAAKGSGVMSGERQADSSLMQSQEPLLRVDDLTVKFGGVTALDGADLSVGKGEICGLIGPNGAGKSTLFNCISRLHEPSGGTIHFAGHDLLKAKPHGIAGLGITRTFQDLALFRSMSVLENIKTGGHHRGSASFLKGALNLRAARRKEAADAEEAYDIMRTLSIDSMANRSVGELPYGTLKRVELGRALMARPTLLMLDEPAAGLTHGEVEELGLLLVELRRAFTLSVLLVEHHMGLVMGVSEKVVVLNLGQTIATGPPREVAERREVVDAYLGTG
jgi:branched-chain amino acid transport system ATP-binding protein